MTSYNQKNWTLILILLVISYFQFKFRFNHPEMTETQLFMNFFKAFKE